MEDLKSGIQILIDEANAEDENEEHKEKEDKECSKEFIKEYVGEQENDLSDLKEKDYDSAMEFLIQDENEAISSYDRIIQLYKNGDKPNKEEVIKELESIKKQEYEHIDRINKLLGKEPKEGE